MDISSFLTEGRILLDLDAPSKDEALDELLAALAGAAEINDFDQYVADVRSREALGSTGIGDGLAFPHARSNAVDKLVIVFGRSRSGIEFDAIDGKPVHLIFLMAAPNADLSIYLKVLAHVSLLLRRESLRQALLSAGAAAEVRRVLSQPLV